MICHPVIIPLIPCIIQGEIEQLTVSSEPGAVSEQCSPNQVPFYENDQGSNDIPSNDIELEEEGERTFVDSETSGFDILP